MVDSGVSHTLLLSLTPAERMGYDQWWNTMNKQAVIRATNEVLSRPKRNM